MDWDRSSSDDLIGEVTIKLQVSESGIEKRSTPFLRAREEIRTFSQFLSLVLRARCARDLVYPRMSLEEGLVATNATQEILRESERERERERERETKVM